MLIHKKVRANKRPPRRMALSAAYWITSPTAHHMPTTKQQRLCLPRCIVEEAKQPLVEELSTFNEQLKTEQLEIHGASLPLSLVIDDVQRCALYIV